MRNVAPFEVRTWRLSDRFLRIGAMIYRKTLESIKESMEWDQWDHPDAGQINAMDPPESYADRFLGEMI